MSESATTSAVNNASDVNADIQALTLQVSALDQSINRSNALFIGASLVAVVAAALVFATQYRVIAKGRKLSAAQNALIAAKDRKLLLDLVEKDSNIAAAGQKAAEAGQKAAEAESAAQSEGLKRAQIEAQLAWRQISADQETKFIAAFSGPLPKNVNVSVASLASDPEGSQYAGEIARLLRKAGLPIGAENSELLAGRLPQGVFLRFHAQGSAADHGAAILQRSFKQAGIDAEGFVDAQIPEDAVEVFIALKPRPKTGAP